MRAINSLVIHHSACLTGSVDVFRKEHRAAGWNDIGYHGVIGNGHGQKDGEFLLGRPESLDGAGVYGNNKGRLHVCLVGNFHKPDVGYTGRPTMSQIKALEDWVCSRSKKYQKRGAAVLPLVGHKEITIPGHGTACPGSEFPIEAVRTWYQRVEPYWERDQATPVSLLAYLTNIGYLSSPGALISTTLPVVVEIVLPDATPNMPDGGAQKNLVGRTIEGATWVPLRELTTALNWPAPTWNPGQRKVTVVRGK